MRIPVPVTPSKIVLGLVAAGLPAIRSVELAVLGEANPVIGLAQGAILNARAAVLRLVADDATKFFVGHSERLTFGIEFLPTHSAAKRRQNQTATATNPQGGLRGKLSRGRSGIAQMIGFSRRRRPARSYVLQ